MAHKLIWMIVYAILMWVLERASFIKACAQLPVTLRGKQSPRLERSE